MLNTFWRLKFTQLFHSVRSRLQIWAQPQSWPRFWTREGPPRSNGRRFARRLLDVKWSRRPPQLPCTAESERPAEPIGYQSIDCTWCNTSPLHGQTENGPKTKRPREHGTNLKEFKRLGPPFLAYHEFHAYRRIECSRFRGSSSTIRLLWCGGWALIITCYGAKWDQF